MTINAIPASHFKALPFNVKRVLAICKDMYDKTKVHSPALTINKYLCKLSIPKEMLTEKVSKLAVIAKIEMGIAIV